MKKYYLSVLTIFKNETMNLNEWISHYLWQGVDHIYMIDNGSTDEPLNIINNYSDQITYFYLDKKHSQKEHYNSVYPLIKEESVWCIMADLDEFWFTPFIKMPEILKIIENDIEVIYSRWVMFGSSGYDKHPPSVREHFIHSWPEHGTDVKYIFQTKNVFPGDLDIHSIIGTDRLKWKNNELHFVLHHYPIQSLEYYQTIKMTRGDVNSEENKRTMDYFREFDSPATKENTILRDLVRKS